MSDEAFVVYQFGSFRLDPKQKLVFRDGVRVKLQKQEFDTLLYLVKNPMDLVTIDKLMKDVWGREVSTSNVRTYVLRVRSKLGDDTAPHRYIDTATGDNGYRFIAEVSRVPSQHAATDHNGRTAATQAGELRLITSPTELITENIAIAREAQRFLLATGSRSRDGAYLESIETALREKPLLEHYRILFGSPHNQGLADHLRRLLQLRDPHNRDHGIQTLHIRCYENFLEGEPERNVCANEHRAVIVLPSLSGLGRYDTALVLRGSSYAEGIRRYVQELCAASKPIESPAAVDGLGVRRVIPERQL